MGGVCIRLAKTFKQNSWNSFVLPVDLTVKQLRDAFGGTVRLAKLNNLTDTELQFETVNLDEMTLMQLTMKYIRQTARIPEIKLKISMQTCTNN